MPDRFDNLRPMGWRYREDGDPHVYVKTTWGSMALTAFALALVGFLVGKCS